MNCEIISCENETEVVKKLMKTIEILAKEAIQTNGVFRLGFSGQKSFEEISLKSTI